MRAFRARGVWMQQQLRRREFIALIGGAMMAARPRTAHAQQSSALPRIGVLMMYASNDPEAQARDALFRDGLKQLGWIDGQNIHLEYRWGANDAKSRQQFAKELVALKPRLVVSHATPTTHALIAETTTIPIIFITVVDPIGSGFVKSLSRPGGNVTGFTSVVPTMIGKWAELLREIAPNVRKVHFLFNPITANYAEYFLEPFKETAKSAGIEAISAPVRAASELEPALAAVASEANSGLVVMPDAFLVTNRVALTSLAIKHRIPAVYPYRLFAELGGLLSYGNDLAENYRRVPQYVDRVLRGTNPAELPVQAPRQFDLVINSKTARALGLNVPPLLISRADEVIE
jgi:putative ABC transport system substrate-binding protein